MGFRAGKYVERHDRTHSMRPSSNSSSGRSGGASRSECYASQELCARLSTTVRPMSPFPYRPMLAIMATLLTDNVAQMSVVSYAGFMVEHLGVVDDKDKAGYFAGILCAAFMIGRLVSSQFWGLVSDRYGCRFVMAFGLCSTAVFSISTGFSPTIAWAVLLRFLVGLLSGMRVAGKTIVSDVCGKEHDTVGMGVTTAAFSLGQVLGPGVGGILSEPAIHHPGTFAEHGILGRYPYLLPNVVVAGMALLSLPLVIIFLKVPERAECKNPTDKNSDSGNMKNVSSTNPASALPIDGDGARVPSWMQAEAAPVTDTQAVLGYEASRLEPDAKDSKQKSLVSHPHIGILLVIDAMYSLTYVGLEAVFCLWALSTIDKGGLEWSAQDIGQVFFTCGLVLLVFELFAVPVFTPLLGVRFCQRLGSVIEIPIHFSIPLLSGMSITGLPARIVAAIVLFAYLAATNPFHIGISLAINNATGSDRRGEMNGISLTTSSLARSVSPVLFSALFAFSIDGDHPFPFDYHLAFYCIGVIRLAVACLGWNRICDNGGVGRKSLMFGE